MRDLTILKAAKHLQRRPEEPTEGRRLEGRPQLRLCQRPSFETAAHRNRLLPISTLYVAEVGQARLRWGGLLRMRPAVFRMLVASSLPLFLALGIDAAHAHAFLDHADPRVGNTVKSPPRTVALWFTQNLESAFSNIEVRDANGAQMTAGKASVDANDRKLLRVPVKALPAGAYTVKWHVLSVDTHTTDGSFTFHVAP
jgi:methionine-rich copper-binding protein CopC